MQELRTEAELLELFGSKPFVIVDAFIDRCAPCAILSPSLQKLSRMIPGVTIVKANFGHPQFSAVKEKYAVTRFPTLLYAVHGEVKDSTVGVDLASIIEAMSHWYENVYEIET